MTILPFQHGEPKRGVNGLKLVDLQGPDSLDEYVHGGHREKRMECQFREKDNEPKLTPTGQELEKDLGKLTPSNYSIRISRRMIVRIILIVVVVFAVLSG